MLPPAELVWPAMPPALPGDAMAPPPTPVPTVLPVLLLPELLELPPAPIPAEPPLAAAVLVLLFSRLEA